MDVVVLVVVGDMILGFTDNVVSQSALLLDLHFVAIASHFFK